MAAFMLRSRNLPFGSISKRQDELKKDESEVDVLQDCVKDCGSLVSKRPSSPTIWLARRPNKIHDNGSRKPKSRYSGSLVRALWSWREGYQPRENHAKNTENML